MKRFKYVAVLAVLLAAVAVHAPAEVAIGVGVGPGYVGAPPVCPYGYYGYYPYACAPYGYYGPDYFVGGVFIGAGPWFHGFYGPRYYGRGFYGRPGFCGRGFAGRGFAGRPGVAIRGGRTFARNDFRGGFHGGGGFHNSFRGGRR